MSLFLCPRWRNKTDLFIYLFIPSPELVQETSPELVQETSPELVQETSPEYLINKMPPVMKNVHKNIQDKTVIINGTNTLSIIRNTDNYQIVFDEIFSFHNL